MVQSHRTKFRRKYRIKSDAFVNKIVECIKKTPQSEINLRLDEYEREAIRQPSRWAKASPIPEIMVIVTKLGFPMTLQMMDERNPLKAYELHKASKEYFRRGNFDKLSEAFHKHNYFCLCGSQIMKEQSLYALLVGGVMFKGSPDSKFLLKSAINKDIRNQKSVDDFLENVYQNSQVGEFDFTDWKIIWMIRKFDNAPVGTLSIHERLGYTEEPETIQRHLTRLVKRGYLQKFGLKKMSSYILTPKSWQAITEAKKRFFKDVRFFDQNHSIEINGSDKTNRTEAANTNP